MGTIYYSLEIKDGQSKILLEDKEISFGEKLVIERNINLADSAVTIDFSSLGTIRALYIYSTKAITATINGSAILVSEMLFVSLTDLTTLTILCLDATGAEVKVVVWATA